MDQRNKWNSFPEHYAVISWLLEKRPVFYFSSFSRNLSYRLELKYFILLSVICRRHTFMSKCDRLIRILCGKYSRQWIKMQFYLSYWWMPICSYKKSFRKRPIILSKVLFYILFKSIIYSMHCSIKWTFEKAIRNN